jgi:hypothetical protein
VPDFTPLSDLAAHYDHRPHGWPGDSDPEPEFPPDPGEAEEMPPEPPEPASEALVHIPDEVLDPEELVPVSAIVRRVEGITAADVVRSVALASRALSFTRVVDDDGQAALDALRDEMKAHQQAIEDRLDRFVTVAHRLHKALTGLRAAALDRVPAAVTHAGALLGAYLRRKEEAEADRQRAEREKALAAERARLKAEADVAEAERRRLAAAAAKAQKTDPAAAQLLQQAADREALAAEQARQDAATVTAPPVAAQTIAAPTGASTRDNWQALPAHAETWDDMPIRDKRDLILFIAARLAADDGSFIHLVDVSTKACNQLAKAQKGTMAIPGLRPVNPPVYSKRGRG